MTPEPAAGVALDRALAERLWTRGETPNPRLSCDPDSHWRGPSGQQTWSYEDWGTKGASCVHGGFPLWSTNASAALGPLCDAMRARGLHLTLTEGPNGWDAWFAALTSSGPSRWCEADTPAEAISRAALAALQALDGEAGQS